MGRGPEPYCSSPSDDIVSCHSCALYGARSIFGGEIILGQSISALPRDWFVTLSARALLCCAAAGLVAGPAPEAHAQSKPKAAAANPAARQSSDAAYVAGVKAFDSGKTKSAVSSLSSALRLGGLPPQKMAKALFYRGSAYRTQGKPAQAISDLTSAIWIKGGLSDADRLAALDQRKAAYREAGLGERVPGNLTPGGSVPSTATAQAVPVAAPVAASPPGPATSAWSTTASAQQSARVAQAPAPSSQPTTSFVPSISPSGPPPSTTLSAIPRGGATPAQQTPSASGPGVGSTLTNIGTNIGSSISQGVSNVGSFFGNMFSGNTNAQAPAQTAQQPSPITTSSTTRSASSAPQAVTDGWGSATSPTTTASRKPVRTAALNSARSAPTTRSAPSVGKFKLQVAAVRSEAKAQQVVTQLQSKYAAQLAGARPEIDAAAIGNMGTFYRVRVGPFANTDQPRGLCARLKSDGYDCLIVTP